MKTKTMKMFAVLAIAVAALLCLTGCSGINITSVGLPTDAELAKGESVQLEISFGADKEDAKADAIAKAAEGLTLVWSSSDETVATVSQSGLVTAVGGGEANITVSIKDANIQSVCKVTVNVPLEGIEAPEDMNLIINSKDSDALEVELLPKDATDVKLAYESSDEDVATVDENGVVTGVAAGEATITVTNKLGKKVTCKVEVTEPAPARQQTTTTRPTGSAGNNNGGTPSTPATQPSGNGGGSTPAPTPDPTPAPQPQPDPAPQPSEPQHYHGNGSDAGTCPVCGAAYSPVIQGGGTYEGDGGDAEFEP